MKILLTCLALLVAVHASAQVRTIRTCRNINKTVTLIEQDTGATAPHFRVQKGDTPSNAYLNCDRTEDNEFLNYKCAATELAPAIQFKLNKETGGATLTSKVFFTKTYELHCEDVTQ